MSFHLRPGIRRMQRRMPFSNPPPFDGRLIEGRRP